MRATSCHEDPGATPQATKNPDHNRKPYHEAVMQFLEFWFARRKP